ncbi:MAG: hypothetical protein QE263_01660 [Vampirovibrionales bacterium]|nr:hypothetical protein [Vampirovibrionales bacterium]
MTVGSIRGAGDPPVCGVLKNLKATAQQEDGNWLGTEITLSGTKGVVTKDDLGQAAILYNAGHPEAPYTGNFSDLHDNMQKSMQPLVSILPKTGSLLTGVNKLTTQGEIATMEAALGCPTDK